MRYCMITFRSVTPAQRGEQVLSRAGIRCNLTRTPRQIAEQGCGYCIRLNRRDLERAVALLRSSGAPFRKIYRQEEGEHFTEVAL